MSINISNSCLATTKRYCWSYSTTNFCSSIRDITIDHILIIYYYPRCIKNNFCLAISRLHSCYRNLNAILSDFTLKIPTAFLRGPTKDSDPSYAPLSIRLSIIDYFFQIFPKFRHNQWGENHHLCPIQLFLGLGDKWSLVYHTIVCHSSYSINHPSIEKGLGDYWCDHFKL